MFALVLLSGSSAAGDADWVASVAYSLGVIVALSRTMFRDGVRNIAASRELLSTHDQLGL